MTAALIGSEKQIAWALTIQAPLLAKIEAGLAELQAEIAAEPGDADQDATMLKNFETAISAVRDATHASDIIDMKGIRADDVRDGTAPIYIGGQRRMNALAMV